MQIPQYISQLVQSYNPNQYEKMMEEPFGNLLRFLLITTIIGLFMFTIFLLPAAYRYIGELPVTLDQVEKFEIDGTVVASQPVNLLAEPSVVLDIQGSVSPSDYDFVFTSQGMTYPKYLFFGSEYIAWEDLRDLKKPTPIRDRALTGIVIFLIPSLLFWFLVYTILELILIFIILLVLGYIIPRALKHEIRFSEVLRVGILSLPSVIIIGIGLYPLAPGPLFWWGFLLTAIVFGIGIFCIAERQTEPRKKGVFGKKAH